MTNIPSLAIPVDRTGLRIRPHHGAAGIVRRLVWHDVVVATLHVDVALDCRLHGGGDPIERAGEVLRHLVVVVAKIVAHADERASKRVLVGRVEVEKILAVRIVAARGADAERVIVPFGRRPFPIATPTRGAGRYRPCQNRPPVCGAGRNPGAAEEPKPRVIKVVAVEVVDIGAMRADAMNGLISLLSKNTVTPLPLIW